MVNGYIWGNLQRAVNDPTLIDQAIDEAIEAHNNDPDAHLEDGQALESHRAAKIIDHRAESVVNDKIAPSARAHTAIVDPSSEEDFDSIAGALAYVISKGGGSILLVAGEYHIDTALEVPAGVSITGQGTGNTLVSCNVSAGPALILGGDELGGNRLSRIEGITFTRTAGTIFAESGNSISVAKAVEFSDCVFSSGGNYCSSVGAIFLFDRCVFNASTTAALTIFDGTFYDCSFLASGAGIFMIQDSAATAGAKLSLIGCTMSSTGSQLINGTYTQSIIDRCHIGLCTDTVPLCREGDSFNVITNSTIIANNSNDLYIRGQDCKVTNNNITALTPVANGSFLRFAKGSARNILTGNALVNQVRSDSGSYNAFDNNTAVNANNFNLGEAPVIASTATVPINSYSRGSNDMIWISTDGTLMVCKVWNSNVIRRWTRGASAWERGTDVVVTAATGGVEAAFAPDTKILYFLQANAGRLLRVDMSLATPTWTFITTGTTNPQERSLTTNRDGSRVVYTYRTGYSGTSALRYYMYDGATMTNMRQISGGRYSESIGGDTYSAPGLPQLALLSGSGAFLATQEARGFFYEPVYPEAKFMYRLGEGSFVNYWRADYESDMNGTRHMWIDEENYFFITNSGGMPVNLLTSFNSVLPLINFSETYTTLYSNICAAQDVRLACFSRDSSNKPEMFFVTQGYFYRIDNTNLPTISTSGFTACSNDGRCWLDQTSTSAATMKEVTYA